MKGFLLDTNVVSEFYKRERGSASVRRWIQTVRPDELFLSVLVVGEIRRGIELLKPKNKVSAQSLGAWFSALQSAHGDRILPVTIEICELWGRLAPRQKLPDIDGLLAATALHHRLTLVTRNKKDVARSGVKCFDPFVDSP